MTTPLFHRHPDDTLTTLSVFQEKQRFSVYRHTGILIESADGTTHRADYRIRFNWPWLGKVLGVRTDLPTVRPLTDRAAFDASVETCIPVGTINIDPDELRSVLDHMATTPYNSLTFNCRDYCVDVLDRIHRKLPLASAAMVTEGTQNVKSHLWHHVSAVDRTLIVCLVFLGLVVLGLVGVWWLDRRRRRRAREK